MKNQIVTRDERTTAVENASYRMAYLVLSFGLLLIAAYRALLWNETTFDLLALVVLGGIVSTWHQVTQGILSRRWALFTVVVALVAAIVAAAITRLR
ncbi:MAG TPA: hypothetical protein VF478_02170 [Anaerolineae bacterium]